jgi:hypothetical protein
MVQRKLEMAGSAWAASVEAKSKVVRPLAKANIGLPTLRQANKSRTAE